MHLSLLSQVHFTILRLDSEWGKQTDYRINIKAKLNPDHVIGDSVHIKFSFLEYVFQALFGFRGLSRAMWSEHAFSCFCSAASSSLNTFLLAHTTAASNRLDMLPLRPLHTQRSLPGRFFLQMSTWFIPLLSSRLCPRFILLAKITLSFPSSLCFSPQLF